MGISQAIIHDPEVLVLDEPTIGIDPNQVVETRQLIKNLSGEHTLLLSSHILPEVSSICERVLIIHEGEIAASDTIKNLSSLMSGKNKIEADIIGSPQSIVTELEKLDAFEDVIMIGYPNGIWDQINNKPIIRNGCTASHPKKDYNGKSEIMINIPSFPGSSGSPVFYKSYDGIRQDKNGLILSPHLKIRLLGILYAGPIFNLQGEVEMSSNALTITTNSPSTMNLGLIIKAEKLKELEEEIIKESFI